MAPEKTSKNLLTTTELSCLIPIKPGFVHGLDTRTFATRLRILMKLLDNFRKTAREFNTVRPIADVVDAISSIHSFSLSVVDGDQHVLLSVVFDRPWEPYMRIIWRDLGPLLDLILCNCKGYEESSSDKGFEAFARYVRGHQVQTGLFYSASSMSVADVQFLCELERLQRDGAPTFEHDAVRLRVPDAVKSAEQAASTHEQDAIEQGLQVLKLLFNMRDLFPEVPGDDREAKFLRRAAELLLKTFPVKAVPPPLKDKFKRELTWLTSALAPGKIPQRLPPPPTELQGGVIKAHKASHGRLLLLRIVDPRQAPAFVDAMRGHVTTHGADPKDGVYLSLAFTFNGLRRLGVPAPELDRFPKEFRDGMQARAGLLGDIRGNHPDNWTLPEWNVDPPGASAPRVRLSTIDMLIDLRYAELLDNDARDQIPALASKIDEIRRTARQHGVQLLSVEPMRNRYAEAEGRKRMLDHFGFVDGLSQPIATLDPPKQLSETNPPDDAVTDSRRVGAIFDDRVPLGEVLMGHRNIRRDGPFPPEAHGSLLDNGTFLVVRKLRQDVQAFNEVLRTNSARVGSEGEVAGLLMGRSRDGVPLADPKHAHNDFNYETEDAQKCPLHAHVRRANPRDVPAKDPDPIVRQLKEPHPADNPRILRRGMSYGPPYETQPDVERGLMFIAYNASIAEQFEVIQSWMSGGNSTKSFGGQPDPFLGVPAVGEPREPGGKAGADPTDHTIVPRTYRCLHRNEPVRIELGSRPFVTLQWGLYLFVPSMTALAALARGQKPAPTPLPDTVVAQIEGLMRQCTTAQQWAALLEDSSNVNGGLTAAVYAVIRHKHGGVFHTRTDYGVLVTTEPLFKEVLGNDRDFSVREYMARMQKSFGPIYLGLDSTDPAYERLSKGPNELLGTISERDGFMLAHAATERYLATVTQGAIAARVKDWVPFSLEELADTVLAAVSKKWLDIPDGAPPSHGPGAPPPFIEFGGRPADGLKPVHCPFHFLAPSRYIFSSPILRPFVETVGGVHGKSAVAAIEALIKERWKKGSAPAGEISRELLKQIPDDDNALARALVGVLEGFVPTVYGGFLKTLYTWLNEETLWRVQQDYRSAAADDPHQRANAIRPSLIRAMQERPVPDMIYRTATVDRPLGPVTIKKDERVVLCVASVTTEILSQGRPDITPIFGGRRKDSEHPTHACPAYDAGLGLLLGMIAALVERRALRPMGYPVMRMEVLPQPVPGLQAALQAV